MTTSQHACSDSSAAQPESTTALHLGQQLIKTMAQPLPLYKAVRAALQQIRAYGGWTAVHLRVESRGEEKGAKDIWVDQVPELRHWYDTATTAVTAVHHQLRTQTTPVLVPDLTANDSFAAAPHPPTVRAYFAFPILLPLHSTPMAVLELFAPTVGALAPALVETILFSGRLLGNTIQHRRTEHALRKSERRLREQLQAVERRLDESQAMAHVGYWEWKVSEDKILWSDELHRIFGFEPGSFDGTYEAYVERLHPEDRDDMAATVRRAIEKRTPYEQQHRIIRLDGEVRWLHGSGRPYLDKHGQIIKLSGVAQDITEHHRAERQLRQTVQQLSAVNEMGQAITASTDLSLIYERVLSLTRTLLRAEKAIIFLQEGEELVVTALSEEVATRLRGKRIPDDSGIAGKVWQTGQSLLLVGEACIQQLSPLLKDVGYLPQAVVAVPIRWQQQAIGVLEVTHRQPDSFRGKDVSMLETAATWTAIAIGNARQHASWQRRLHESEAIARISRALSATLDLDKVLNLIVDIARQIIPNVDWAAIHLLETNSKRLYPVAMSGLDLAPDNYTFDPGQGIVGYVLNEGGVINVADLQQDPRRTAIDKSIHTRSLLVAPVQGRIQRIGTLSVQYAQPDAYSAEDEQLLSVLGVQAGMAIENARLFASQLRARQAAEARREQMRELNRKIVAAQEEERHRISRELHDGSGQALTSLKIGLDLLSTTLPDEMEDVRAQLMELSELTGQTMDSLRVMAHDLRPPALDAFGIDAILSSLCEGFAHRAKVAVKYKGQALPQLAPVVAHSLYRLMQEALTNIAKHAAATQVEVYLGCAEDIVTLRIDDNGKGFVANEESLPELVRQGIGLANMYERADLLGGRFEIASRPGKGTRITVHLPYLKEEVRA